MTRLFAALLIAGLAAPLAQTPQTGRLSGLVVTGADRQPVRLAIVTLAGPDLPYSRSAISDDAGRFAFADVPPGRFTLTASKAAHITNAYGARRPGRPGTPVTVAAGQHLRDLTIDLPRGAVIAGTVRDPQGQPAPGVVVSAVSTGALGLPGIRISPVEVSTDDRGMYRIFGLTPGEYVVVATMRVTGTGEMGAMTTEEVDAAMLALRSGGVSVGPGGAAAAAAAQRTYGFVSTYHPSTADAASAMRLRVDAGDERPGTDIGLQLVRTATVAGTVTSPDGSSPQSVRVSLQPDGPSVGLSLGRQPMGGLPDRTGRFQFTHVVPGRYRVLARTSQTRGGPPVPLQWAAADVTVDGEDISEVALTMRPGLRVSGRVVIEGDDPTRPALDQLRIVLGPERPAIPAGVQAIAFTPGGTAPVGADGTFSIAGMLPGRYQLTVGTTTRPGPDWSLQSAIVNGRDALDYGLEIDAEDVTAVVTYSNRQTELTGSLQTSDGQPATDYFVIVFPDDRGLWRPGARRVQTTRPDTAGRFTVRGLPPGAYRIAALTDVEPDEWHQPEFLAAILPSSVAFTLAPGERRHQDLRIAR